MATHPPTHPPGPTMIISKVQYFQVQPYLVLHSVISRFLNVSMKPKLAGAPRGPGANRSLWRQEERIRKSLPESWRTQRLSFCLGLQEIPHWEQGHQILKSKEQCQKEPGTHIKGCWTLLKPKYCDCKETTQPPAGQVGPRQRKKNSRSASKVRTTKETSSKKTAPGRGPCEGRG